MDSVPVPGPQMPAVPPDLPSLVPVRISLYLREAQTATLKGPDGKTVTIKAQDPKNLEAVKVGDEVVITYTEALAISVEKAPKK